MRPISLCRQSTVPEMVSVTQVNGTSPWSLAKESISALFFSMSCDEQLTLKNPITLGMTDSFQLCQVHDWYFRHQIWWECKSAVPLNTPYPSFLNEFRALIIVICNCNELHKQKIG
jgi:hypothetical protein